MTRCKQNGDILACHPMTENMVLTLLITYMTYKQCIIMCLKILTGREEAIPYTY